MPVHPRPRRDHRERGFGIVEVVVAVLIVSVVVTGAVVAASSSDRVQVRTKVVADMHSMAERAVERASGDLSARSTCEVQQGWRQSAQTAARSGSAAAATFRPCVVTYDDFRDEQGRTYQVRVTVRPVDRATDGLGAADADNNFRDDYQVTTRVELAPDSRIGVEGTPPLSVDGSIGWPESNSDFASVRVYACGLNRPDRSLSAGGCAVSDVSRTQLRGVRLQLQPIRTDPTNTATTTFSITTGTNGVGEATALVQPGSYQLVAPERFNDASGGRWTRFRVDPGGLQVKGSGRYDVNVTYVRETDRTINFCTQLMTRPAVDPDVPSITYDDGFEAYSTNLNYRGMGSPAYRSVRLDVRRDRGWACSRVIAQPGRTSPSQPWLLRDPLAYQRNSDPFVGQYDLEIEQNYGDYRATQRYGMRVHAVSVDCTAGLPWNRPLNGTQVPARPFDPLNDRPVAPGETAPWYGRYNLNDTRSHRICIRLEPKTFDRDRCTGPNDPNGAYRKGAPGVVPPTAVQTGRCFYVRTECIRYCPDGGRICVANCSYQWQGSTGAIMQGEAAKPFGGPADPTVGCRPQQQGAYQWFGWSPPVIFEGQVGRGALESNWSRYQWVGGGEYYYNNYSGHYGSGPVFYCQAISFAASSRYLCRQGTNTPVTTVNGFVECRYRYGDCIQAELPQYPGVYVRGIMRDVSVNYTKPIIPSINALRALAYVNGIDRPETIQMWDPGSWWDSLDLRIRKVDGDPTCDDTGRSLGRWPRWDDVDPVLVDIWHRIVDERDLRAPNARPAAGNVASDRVAI